MRLRRFLVRSGLGLACAAAVALACGSFGESMFIDGTNEPCTTVYAGKCGGACSSDAECIAGLHCGPEGKCTAVCAPSTGLRCTNGVPCSPRGRCGPDFTGNFSDADTPTDATITPPDNICADIDIALSKILPKVLFLLDQSSSMFYSKFPSGDSNGCNPDCRWTVLKDVLIGPANNPGGLIKQLQNEAELGVEMYSATDPNPNDGDNSLLPGPTDPVCPRFNGKAFDGLAFAQSNYPAIESLLRDASVDDDTPTGPAVRSVVGLTADGGVIDGGFAATPGTQPKVLVLVTDGEPMLCGESFPTDPGKAAVVSAVQQTYSTNIKTFVVAIGDISQAAEAHFKAVANAGQGKDVDAGDAGAIRPSTQQALVDALKQIVLDARTCKFTLNGKVQAGKEKLGTVTLNGTPVPFDDPGAPDEGWHLLSDHELELVGNACKTLKETPDAKLSARFPCEAVVTIPK